MDRRDFLKLLAFTGIAIQSRFILPEDEKILMKKIPKSGELIPVIGMGTWITFNVGSDRQRILQRTEVLSEFFKQGGTIIDSSPMYGSAEEVIGKCYKNLKQAPKMFSATKVWTSSFESGKRQFQDSLNFWGVDKLDLYQIHNLVNWKEHLPYLRELKKQGKIKYLGITTSHGRSHDEFYQIMKSEDIDFVQLTYNIFDREVESKLLPLAKDRGIAVIANRPFQGGHLTDLVKKHELPPFAKEYSLENWPQVLLKYIVSHPSVTCAIPATSRKDHMSENMSALRGVLLTSKQRTAIENYVRKLS